MTSGSEKNRVYFDWAAATPMSEAAFSAMEPFLRTHYGNPGAIHQEGVRAQQAVETARGQIAEALQVRPEFVTFTGGGTEANNLAILGTIEALQQTGRAFNDMEVITSPIEHPSVSRTLERLGALGVVIKRVAVDVTGVVQLADLREQLNARTVLVSVAYANSEIGTVQPVRAIRKAVREAEAQFGADILMHIDAAQAPLWLSCQFSTVAADLLTLDALKCCGPKGVGILVRSRRAQLTAVVHGGGQEAGLRPGTENVAGIVGAGVAIAQAQANWRECAERVSAVRDAGIEQLLDALPTAVLNGAVGAERLANNINISIPGLDTEFAAVVLDSKGFAVSTKSACAGAGGGESTVVKAISGDPARAASTLRITIGPDATVEQLVQLTQVLAAHSEKMAAVT